MNSSIFAVRQVTTLVVIALVLGVGLSQLSVYFSTQHRSRSVWVISASGFIVLSLLLLTDNITLAVAQWTGLNNIGWYLGYAAGAVGCYQFGRIACITDMHPYGSKVHRGLLLIFVGLLIQQATFFATQLMHSPEWLPRTPRTAGELLFSNSYFLFCSGTALLDSATVWLAIQREENPAQRLRLWLTLLGAISALICFVGKLFYLTLYFVYTDLVWLNDVALFAMVGTGLLLPLALMPGWFFRLLVFYNPFTYLYQLWRLYWLVNLATIVYQLMPNLFWRRYDLIYQLRHSRPSLYRFLIAILDGKKLLVGCLKMSPEQRQKVAGAAWSEEQIQQASKLHQALQSLDQMREVEYTVLVSALVRISQQMRFRDDIFQKMGLWRKPS